MKESEFVSSVSSSELTVTEEWDDPSSCFIKLAVDDKVRDEIMRNFNVAFDEALEMFKDIDLRSFLLHFDADVLDNHKCTRKCGE